LSSKKYLTILKIFSIFLKRSAKSAEKLFILGKKWAARGLVSRFENRAKKRDFWGDFSYIYNRVITRMAVLAGISTCTRELVALDDLKKKPYNLVSINSTIGL